MTTIINNCISYHITISYHFALHFILLYMNHNEHEQYFLNGLF